ncbi:hypothetical protein BDP81DRAFT_423793 [Colletotrichum phormii]|uniref:Uncharacterized protein n=1 Tax=Colletotrichum phormii TaxID=359342 RepID=A0AAI9ZW18_9PEZI|nr:uncharacterized protein BDP81DRAFT_423793 [Colletotrichum phormii]KAK1639260.1 hypothetical protein BDP81DRAFT_423793 [Colletotrichum phormii]
MGMQFSESLTANDVLAARSNGRCASYGARSGIWRDSGCRARWLEIGRLVVL